MQGTVSKASGLLLGDILLLLSQTRQTGCLNLNRREGDPATVNFSAGAVLNATCGSRREADAIREMLEQPTWEFDLHPEIADAEARFNEQLASLLNPSNAHAPSSNGANHQGERSEWRPQLLDYVIDEKGPRGGFSNEDAEVLAADLDFFQTAAHLFATRLGENSVRELAVTEPGQSMAFALGGSVVYAVAGVNSDMETTVARVRTLAAGSP